MTFYNKVKYNGDTLNQMWMSMIADSHDIHCSCNSPFGHLLNSIFPEGHSDRKLTIEQIIKRDIQLCHSGGEEEKDFGIPLGGSAATILEKEDADQKEGEPEDIDLLLAAAAAEDATTR